MLPTTPDCYLVPLAIIDSGGDHGASVTTSQVITEVGESISQLNSSKISMIDPSHVKEQAWFSFCSHFQLNCEAVKYECEKETENCQVKKKW